MSRSDADLLRGIHELVNLQNVKPGTDYSEIERKLISNGNIKTGESDPNEAFKNELSSLAKTLGLKFDSPTPSARSAGANPKSASSSVKLSSPVAFTAEESEESDEDNGLGLPSSYLSSPSHRSQQSPLSYHSPQRSPPHHSPQHSPSPRQQSPMSSPLSSPHSLSPQLSQSQLSQSQQDPFAGFNYSDNQSMYGGSAALRSRTHEQLRQEQIKNVMSNMSDANFISLEEASKEDEKTNMLEEIDSLRASLEEEDAKGLDKIPVVTQNNTYAEVENVLRRLRLKNDRARYTGLADEFLLWGAQCAEELFDGKRKFMGKSPDLTGWSKEVHVKLRRMRHDTSTLVSGVMHDYNIGPGMRILLELVPNVFMYAKRRKQSYGKASMYASDDIARHMQSIRNIDSD